MLFRAEGLGALGFRGLRFSGLGFRSLGGLGGLGFLK